MPRLRRKSRHLWSRVTKNKGATEEQLDHADTNLVADVQIKTEVLDVEETTDTSVPDITVETHESVEELRRVLNLPETQIHREPPTIKSEESCFNTSSLQDDGLNFSISEQSASDSCAQYFNPSDISPQSSHWAQITSTKGNISVSGTSNLLDKNVRSQRRNDHTCVVKSEESLKHPMVEIPPKKDVESEIGTNKKKLSDNERLHSKVLPKRTGWPGYQPGTLRLTERHFPEFVPPTEKKATPCRNCAVCCSKRDVRGKKIRKETRYYCRNCNVGLCAVPCFMIYHTKLNF